MPGEMLHCPIRGTLTVAAKAADGLTFTEEKRRIDCIRFLLEKGYPPKFFKIETVLLRFGHKGRNSFRTDIAILDAPVSTLPDDVEALKPHIKLVAEIKRDNKEAESAKQTQVYPAMDFLHDISAYGIYWDDIQQRLFFRTLKGSKTKTHETTVALLPPWGQALGSTKLRRKDLRPTNLLRLFEQIEDGLHALMTDQSARFEVMLQLLLVKIYDEHTHPKYEQEMSLQDYTDAPLGDGDVVEAFEKILDKALKFYGKYLPKVVPNKMKVNGSSLRGISAMLAPIVIFGSKRDVIQDFYMYFAKGVYKWDLAQYFTPTEVVDFIVTLTNPQAGDQVKDPACGSGDFLISSLHHTKKHEVDIRDAVWGADNSENAVQVAVLNMVLNGDGKSNIQYEDSLLNIEKTLDSYSVMLCNPPFGIKIVERRFDVLKKFDMAHAWEQTEDGLKRTERVQNAQETGLLFAELCVKQATPGGRIGIILPNGYLGNRSNRYLVFREWLLRQAKLVAVVGFPRFTFKKSGADVSASVILVEKREIPLKHARDSEKYPFYAALLESVGWSVGDKRAERIFKRHEETGAVLVNDANEPIIDADFDRVLKDLYSSLVPSIFPWLTAGLNTKGMTGSWSVPIQSVFDRDDLSIDPKRWCQRVSLVREKIATIPHFSLGEVVDVIPQEKKPNNPTGIYRLIEIDNIADGGAMPVVCRGWQLPSRARHGAQKGDIYVGAIWSSVGRWFLAGGDCTSLIVTNGMHRLRLKPGKETMLLDVVAGLNTESYRIQARAFTTGSDGLADLPEESLKTIILPKITDKDARATIQAFVDALLEGRSTVEKTVDDLIKDGKMPKIDVRPRSHHVVLV